MFSALTTPKILGFLSLSRIHCMIGLPLSSFLYVPVVVFTSDLYFLSR